ncbi:MAG: hypothetical protein K0U68_08500 [Gammaproteobacteria bacterium]|nr:hypothetical protein [Gammaproteobacteria bacterium]
MRASSALVSTSLLIVTVLSNSAACGEFAGFSAIEYRQFFQQEQFSRQRSGSIPSLITEPEYYHQSDDRQHSFVARLFFHYDPNDDERTHFDIRQADWTFAENDWELRLGISKVYWGVAESRHLVDTINQVDAVEDVDEEDRLGQPMMQFALFKDWGTLRFFYLPYFRERTFPGTRGRLRGPFVIDDNDARYQKSLQEWYPNVALRYEHAVGNWDLGIAQFHGTNREPVFIIDGNRITPLYQTINQTSVDLQYTDDAWLWKLETLFRSSRHDDFFAVTGGFEYSIFGLFDTDHDLGLLAEYHYDGRNHRSPLSFFDHDVFLGARYVFNNISDSELLAGVTTDLKGEGATAVIEASHRINDHWKIEFDTRLFIHIDKNSFFSFLNQDKFMQLRLSYFF